jgi:hypothetical protein
MQPDPSTTAAKSALASLRRYARPRAARIQCELCSAPLTDDHSHLVELAGGKLCCTCEPCAILFGSPAAAKYRRVPRGSQFLADFRMTDVDWEGLQLPINLAFFVHSSAAGKVVALYPSPGGATEALPPPDAWEAVVEANPSLRNLEPDVEALLVNRLGAEPEYYRVGIDECYALVGLVRKNWRGLSGGAAVWKEIAGFFTGLNGRSRPGAAAHA